MRGTLWWLGLVCCLFLAQQVRFAQVVSPELRADFTNIQDEILTIEGETELPTGSLLRVEMKTREGMLMEAKEILVADERWYSQLSLKTVMKGRDYQIEFFFDPFDQPQEVLSVIGDRGQFLAGDSVSQVGGRYLFQHVYWWRFAPQDQLAGARGWEGMDPKIVVSRLEDYLIRYPQDGEAYLQLGLAYIRWRQAERYYGGRAYRMLKSGLTLSPDSDLSAQARSWISRLEQEERRRKIEAERERILAQRGMNFLRANLQILPGEQFGPVKMGAPYQSLLTHALAKKPPNVNSTEQWQEVIFDNFEDVSILLDMKSMSFVRAQSGDSRYQTKEGLSADSTIEEWREHYPQLRWRSLSQRTRGEDGRWRQKGRWDMPGLVLRVETESDPLNLMTRHFISSIEVHYLSPKELKALQRSIQKVEKRRLAPRPGMIRVDEKELEEVLKQQAQLESD